MLKQAVFLAGGLGTRLGSLTQRTPKPMLPAGGKPFLAYLVDEAARHGFDDILILAGYLGEEIERYFQGTTYRDAKVRVLREPEPLGTGGALRFAAPELNSQFLLANGDTFFDINLRALPVPPPGGLSMALRTTAPGARYGSVKFESGNVLAFHSPADRISGPINGGIYNIDKGLIDLIPQGKSSLEGDIFPVLANKGFIRGVLFDGYFIDIGIQEDLEKADREMNARTTRPAIFFDRDGVLNRDAGYTHRIDSFEWTPGAKEAIRRCNDRGVFAFVVTNQAGVARGLYDETAIADLHDWMQGNLAAMGAHIDAFEYCPHHPEGDVARYRTECRRRKPNPGMIEDLLRGWHVASAQSVLVGDKSSDLEAAHAAGIPALLYTGGDLCEFLDAHIEKLAMRVTP